MALLRLRRLAAALGEAPANLLAVTDQQPKSPEKGQNIPDKQIEAGLAGLVRPLSARGRVLLLGTVRSLLGLAAEIAQSNNVVVTHEKPQKTGRRK